MARFLKIFLPSALLAGLAPTVSLAADLPWIPQKPPAPVPLSSNFSVEIFTGYLTATVNQYSYDCCDDKIAQTKWKIENAAILGGGFSYNWNWIDLRLSGWSVIASSNTSDSFAYIMDCYYCGSQVNWRNDSAKLPRMYQLDASVSASFYQTASFAISGLVGYRFLNLGLKESGGQIAPSDVYGDLSGLPLSSAYEQRWHTPYVGLGAQYDGGGFRLAAEVIGSPFVFGKDRARLNSITTDSVYIYQEQYISEADYETWMLGGTLAGEYRLTTALSLTGKAQYQYFEEKKKRAKVTPGADDSCCTVYPHSQSGDLSALTLTVGLKASF